jgi:hypothetical protein
MDQHARMFKVIASLVVTMTVTTGLLIWIEPSTTTAQELVPALAVEQAQRVVATEALIPTGRWYQIDVGICPEPRVSRSSTLVAMTSDDPFHFVVSTNGHVRATAFWHQQLAIGELSDVVRIGVACHCGKGELSMSQQAALEALIVELSHRCAPPDGWRAVSFHDALDGGWLADLRYANRPHVRA